MATRGTVLAQMFANNYTNTVTSGNDWGYFKYDDYVVLTLPLMVAQLLKQVL